MKSITFRDLRPDEIEVRVGATVKDRNGTPTGFQVMLYKTARVDTTILDETFGIFGWKNHYYQVKNTMICSVSIWDEDKKEWVNKDNGGDDDFSMEQVKAECSDSMKRCCFNLGIGKKLYSASKIYMVVPIDDNNDPKKSRYQVDEIEYDETSITKLVISNKKTKEVVISHGVKRKYNQDNKKVETKKEDSPTMKNEDSDDENMPIREEEKAWIQDYIGQLSGDRYNDFFNWLEKDFGTRRIADLTASQGIIIVSRLKRAKK